ncbi:MAG: response regulator, partial [Clostridia bacterium]|nr:response regulator [Clostridia bacterium]
METKIKVLIADAGEDYRTLLRDTLNAESDMEVVGTAADGAEALALLERERPDVLLLDLVLPRMDGLEVLRRMGETGAQPATLIVSAFYNQQMITRSAELGAWYFIPKPCDVAALTERIRQCARREEAVPAAVTEIRPQEPDLESTVTEVIHEIGVPAHIKG